MIRTPIILILFFVCFQSNISYSQNNTQITIEGVISNSESNEKIPYVNISVLHSAVGTSSDNNGYFKITLNDTSKYLVLSCISFKRKKIPIDDLLLMDSVVLQMDPDTFLMANMVFREKEESADEILQAAFSTIDKNGYDITQYYSGLISASKNTTYYNLEALLEYSKIVKDSNFLGAGTCVLQKKNNQFEDYNSNIEEYLFRYFSFYFNIDNYSYHCNIANKDCRSKLNFNIANYVLYNSKLCYVVDYQFIDLKNLKVDNKKLASLKGTLYIESENYSIIRWEINGEFDMPKERIINKAGKYGYPEKFKWIRNYRIVNGIAFMSLSNVIQSNISFSNNEKTIITLNHSSLTKNVQFNNNYSGGFHCENGNINLVKYQKDFWDNFK